MIDYLVYLLKASACLAAFHLVYGMFLRHSTLFTLNRVYLAGGLVLSFIIPLLSISVPAVLPDYTPSLLAQALAAGVSESDYPPLQTLSPVAKSAVYPTVMLVVYCSGVLYLLLRQLLAINKILRLSCNGQTVRCGRGRIVTGGQTLPFSFFNRIFLPEGPIDPLVVEHERVHIGQRHWIDLLLFQTASLLLWFNPLVRLYGCSLKLQHEYLADRAVASGPAKTADYLQCMLREVEMASLGALSSPFYQKTTKKRIVMMTKNRTSRKFAWLYLFILPLAGVLMAGFTPRVYAMPPAETTDKEVQVQTCVPSGYPLAKESVTRTGTFGPKDKRIHTGIDLGAAQGTPIVSTADGVVLQAGYDSGWGNVVVIKHGDRYTTLYAHMRECGVTTGQTVTKGQAIGSVGSTGRSTGPHLHYEVRDREQPVDPAVYLD